MAIGILYGCEAPKLPPPDGSEEGDDSPAYDLVMRWEKAKKIDWLKTGPRIRVESEGDKELLGVWVAVGGSGEDGAPYFVEKAMLLADVSNAFDKRIAKAEKLWSHFAAWVEKTDGVELPTPKLWLTPCEVA